MSEDGQCGNRRSIKNVGFLIWRRAVQIPYFNAQIFLENKTAIGKVDEIFGSINASVNPPTHPYLFLLLEKDIPQRVLIGLSWPAGQGMVEFANSGALPIMNCYVAMT